jgi:hypothetical protein
MLKALIDRELNFCAVVCAELNEQIWLYKHIQLS